jgi:hypothetical protein
MFRCCSRRMLVILTMTFRRIASGLLADVGLVFELVFIRWKAVAGG